MLSLKETAPDSAGLRVDGCQSLVAPFEFAATMLFVRRHAEIQDEVGLPASTLSQSYCGSPALGFAPKA